MATSISLPPVVVAALSYVNGAPVYRVHAIHDAAPRLRVLETFSTREDMRGWLSGHGYTPRTCCEWHGYYYELAQ